ncbi:PRD domain-containing protein [Collinsella sp. AF37-9]|nr:PRD domain-containing protein [Collinsella sp. AF37-9]
MIVGFCFGSLVLFRGGHMEIVKRINTSAVLCVDGNGRQLVAFGRGLGFKNVGDEVPLSEIQRTFYNVSSRYIALVDEVPDELLELTSDVIDMSTGLLSYEVSPNLPFILADHIAYAVKRKEQNIVVRMPLSFDVRQQYPVEFRIGEYALKIIRKRLNVRLPAHEAVGIAMAFINNMADSDSCEVVKEFSADIYDRVLEESTVAVENRLGIQVDREGFDYARFATHLQYLFNRLNSGESIVSDNRKMYLSLKKEYPVASMCADDIASVLSRLTGRELIDEERLYLMMHINRIASKTR